MDTLEECPCESCDIADYCDAWESKFCCILCQWLGAEHCAECDPYDI